MSSSGFLVPISPELADRLAALPGASLARQNAAFERAIHRALDVAGWPDGERGEINVPASYWFVNVPRGHVGPIPDEQLAHKVARSWKQTGCSPSIDRYPRGPALTNPV